MQSTIEQPWNVTPPAFKPPAPPAAPQTRCAHCGAWTRAEALNCEHCGALLRLTATEAARYARPLWQVGLFITLSLGLYLLPWAARTARFIDIAQGGGGKRGRATLRSLGLLVPLYNFRAIYRLAADMRDVALAHGIYDGPDAGLVTWAYVGAVVGGRILPGGLALLAFPCLLAAVLPVQRRVNAVCEQVDAGVTARRSLQVLDYIGLVIGLALTGVALLGLLAPSA